MAGVVVGVERAVGNGRGECVMNAGRLVRRVQYVTKGSWISPELRDGQAKVIRRVRASEGGRAFLRSLIRLRGITKYSYDCEEVKTYTLTGIAPRVVGSCGKGGGSIIKPSVWER
jgi:hypothetical protein